MAVTNAQALAQALIDAAVAGYSAGLDGAAQIEPLVWIGVQVPMSIALAIRSAPAASSVTGAIWADAVWPEQFCRVCGCTEDAACDGGCSWVEPDLCSACVGKSPIVLELSRVEVAP